MSPFGWKYAIVYYNDFIVELQDKVPIIEQYCDFIEQWALEIITGLTHLVVDNLVKTAAWVRPVEHPKGFRDKI